MCVIPAAASRVTEAAFVCEPRASILDRAPRHAQDLGPAPSPGPTSIRYYLDREGPAWLDVIDLAGRHERGPSELPDGPSALEGDDARPVSTFHVSRT
jgi:hypothetical protein